MKLNQRASNESNDIAKQALSLMERLPNTGISIECDEETGLSFIHDMGAFGVTPDMPRELSEAYLSDQISSLLTESRSG